LVPRISSEVNYSKINKPVEIVHEALHEIKVLFALKSSGVTSCIILDLIEPEDGKR
jgi:hypothetical protein